MREFKLIMITIVLTMLFCVFIFPLNTELPQWYLTKYNVEVVPESDPVYTECLDFYDTIWLKYGRMSDKYGITLEEFMNDTDFFNELMIVWAEGKCLKNQGEEVWSMLE